MAVKYSRENEMKRWRRGRGRRGERVVIPLSVILGAQKCESLNQLKSEKTV